jgi:hypothetical protein
MLKAEIERLTVVLLQVRMETYVACCSAAPLHAQHTHTHIRMYELIFMLAFHLSFSFQFVIVASQIMGKKREIYGFGVVIYIILGGYFKIHHVLNSYYYSCVM